MPQGVILASELEQPVHDLVPEPRGQIQQTCGVSSSAWSQESNKLNPNAVSWRFVGQNREKEILVSSMSKMDQNLDQELLHVQGVWGHGDIIIQDSPKGRFENGPWFESGPEVRVMDSSI